MSVKVASGIFLFLQFIFYPLFVRAQYTKPENKPIHEWCAKCKYYK